MMLKSMLFINYYYLFLQLEQPPPPIQAHPLDISQMSSLIVNAVLTLVTIVSIILTLRLSKKRSEVEHKLVEVSDTLAKAQEYIKSLSLIEYLYQDIVLLGPQNSGKTSVAKLWTEPAFDIQELSHTIQWKTYERDILEFGQYTKKNETLALDIKHHRRLRIRVHDYPGEDRFRLKAINELPKLHNPVLILFFNVQADSRGIQTIHENNSYYSQAFMEAVKSQTGITVNIPKVIAVFNKADLLPTKMSLDEAEEILKQVNIDAVSRVESLFSGKLSYLTISAKDNRGLIKLLGACGSPTLPAEVKKLFQDKIDNLALKAH